jgi:hypothetical protein
MDHALFWQVLAFGLLAAALAAFVGWLCRRIDGE